MHERQNEHWITIEWNWLASINIFVYASSFSWSQFVMFYQLTAWHIDKVVRIYINTCSIVCVVCMWLWQPLPASISLKQMECSQRKWYPFDLQEVCTLFHKDITKLISFYGIENGITFNNIFFGKPLYLYGLVYYTPHTDTQTHTLIHIHNWNHCVIPCRSQCHAVCHH